MKGYGSAWLDAHTCPPPYPRDIAEQLVEALATPGAPVAHPLMLARIRLGLR